MSCVNPWFSKQAGIDAKVVDCIEAEEHESIELLVFCRNIYRGGWKNVMDHNIILFLYIVYNVISHHNSIVSLKYNFKN